MNLQNTSVQSVPSEVKQPQAVNLKIISQSFTDADQFTEFTSYRQMEVRQLSCGLLQSKFLGIQLGRLNFTHAYSNQSMQTFGAKQRGYVTFSLIWDAEGGHFYTFGQPRHPQTDLCGFDTERGTALVTPQQGVMSDILIPTNVFETYANQLQRHDLDDRFLATNHVSILPDRMNQIKDYLRNLFWLAEHNPRWLE
jgi:AraC family ethanolamine operon transcriptional activator